MEIIRRDDYKIIPRSGSVPHQVSTPIKCIFALQIKKREQEYPSPFDEISMGKDKFAIDTSF